eukprot:458005-Pleurochrysis_carterae.AAC.1
MVSASKPCCPATTDAACHPNPAGKILEAMTSIVARVREGSASIARGCSAVESGVIVVLNRTTGEAATRANLGSVLRSAGARGANRPSMAA